MLSETNTTLQEAACHQQVAQPSGQVSLALERQPDYCTDLNISEQFPSSHQPSGAHRRHQLSLQIPKFL
jgi:hypothetical protein